MSVLKADEKAADRVLKAAVRRAREYTVEGIRGRWVSMEGGHGWVSRDYDRDAIAAVLERATYAADLLLTDTTNGGKR